MLFVCRNLSYWNYYNVCYSNLITVSIKIMEKFLNPFFSHQNRILTFSCTCALFLALILTDFANICTALKY